MSRNLIKIGTRGSRLALAQTRLLIDAISLINPGLVCEITVIHTQGDRISEKPLYEFGGKGVFVSEFEDALLNNEIDLAVHSAKDMPMELKEGLDIIGVLKREDPRDVLITRAGNDIGKKTAMIGTSSLRRQVQAEKLMSDIKCVPLRGNIDTRLRKLSDGLTDSIYDGIILAAAGIKRLNLNNDPKFIYRYLEVDEFTPAGGQGIIAIEGVRNSRLLELIDKITDSSARIELEIERRALELFTAGCSEAIGVHSRVSDYKATRYPASDNEVTIWMMKENNGKIIRKTCSAPLDKRLELVDSMVRQLQEDF